MLSLVGVLSSYPEYTGGMKLLFATFTLHLSSEDFLSGTAGLYLGGRGGLLLTILE